MFVCTPWVTPETTTLCKGTDFKDPDMLALALQAASDLLYVASGRQFPGVCTDEIRPCCGGGGLQELRHLTGGSYVVRDWSADGMYGACGSCRPLSCGCSWHPAVEIPNTPIVAVLEIEIDGVGLIVTPGVGDVRIVNDRWLIRSDGGSWPSCNHLNQLTGDGTFVVRYSWGPVTPAAGVMAAQVLGCELAKNWSGCECQLPRRIQSFTREGFTAAVLDPFDFLDDGKFGLYEVDAFIMATNPDHVTRQGKLIDPEDAFSGPFRVR